MKGYRSILAELGTLQLLACAEGEAGVPLLPTYSAPAEWYGFPPALIPIWSDGSGPNYLGIWKHWFTKRPYSFVKNYVGLGHLAVEIARTEQQFFAYIAIQSISIHDGVNLALRTFANRVGLPDLKELDEVTIKHGDDPQGFRSLSMFASVLPLESAEVALYDGSFPVPNSDSIIKASPFEFKEELFPTMPERPEWLNRYIDKGSLFESYMSSGNLEAAWFTLNSNGWSYRDAAICARSLAARSPDALFKALIAVWSDLAANDSGGY